MVMQRSLILSLVVGLLVMMLGVVSIHSVTTVDNAGAIGVIGGSDGPTAIFISGPAETSEPEMP